MGDAGVHGVLQRVGQGTAVVAPDLGQDLGQHRRVQRDPEILTAEGPAEGQHLAADAVAEMPACRVERRIERFQRVGDRRYQIGIVRHVQRALPPAGQIDVPELEREGPVEHLVGERMVVSSMFTVPTITRLRGHGIDCGTLTRSPAAWIDRLVERPSIADRNGAK